MSTLTRLYGCLEVVLTVSFPKLTVYPSPPFVRAKHRHPLNISQRKSTRLTSHCESRRPRTTLSSPPRSVINCKDCQAGTAGGNVDKNRRNWHLAVTHAGCRSSEGRTSAMSKWFSSRRLRACGQDRARYAWGCVARRTVLWDGPLPAAVARSL